MFYTISNVHFFTEEHSTGNKNTPILEVNGVNYNVLNVYANKHVERG